MKAKPKIKKEPLAQKIQEPELENKPGIFSREGELVVDVFETNSEFVVLAAIAGIQIKDIDISLEKEMLVIKGNRQSPNIGLEKKYFYQECYWGPFSRKIVLPENINIAEAAAEMDKGVLTIKIPKAKQGNKEKIEVKVS
ncbi:MAG: Hsp20/alpha crystallin family protein [Candidatus Staskawiczbacteria bacterium]|nr:Hsp20/alpha crystallin family protein [Candidatus Staskawiczbacteria bacterium]